jgi:hypothetical protein
MLNNLIKSFSVSVKLLLHTRGGIPIVKFLIKVINQIKVPFNKVITFIKNLEFYTYISINLFIIFIIFILYNTNSLVFFIVIRVFIILNMIKVYHYLDKKNIHKRLDEQNTIFNNSVPNNYLFVIFLRKYHYLVLFSGYISYSVFNYLLINSTNNGLILLSLVFTIFSVILFFIQFSTYSFYYLKSIKKKYKSIPKQYNMSQIRHVHKFFSIETLTYCKECVKVIFPIIAGAEVISKLCQGSLTTVSPWRAHILNLKFPDDKTHKWDEFKAARAIHAEAMGKPHESIYTEEDVFEKFLSSYNAGVVPLSKHKGLKTPDFK